MPQYVHVDPYNLDLLLYFFYYTLPSPCGSLFGLFGYVVFVHFGPLIVMIDRIDWINYLDV